MHLGRPGFNENAKRVVFKRSCGALNDLVLRPMNIDFEKIAGQSVLPERVIDCGAGNGNDLSGRSRTPMGLFVLYEKVEVGRQYTRGTWRGREVERYFSVS